MRHVYTLRFDYPIKSFDCDPDYIASHSFYPFLAYDMQRYRYSKDAGLRKRPRPIRYASHKDSLIYRHYAVQLADKYEMLLDSYHLDEVVIAYRRLGKSNVDFAKGVFDGIRSVGRCVVFTTDISDFFDTIDHGRLKQAWQWLLGQESLPLDHYKVFRSITRYAWVERDALFNEIGFEKLRTRRRICGAREFREIVRPLIKVNDTGKGIPQGASISAVLSNMVMFEFDKKMDAFAQQVGGIYRRYADDIILVLPGESSGARSPREFVECALRAEGFTPSRDKSREFHFDDAGRIRGGAPLTYLGFSFDGEKVLLRAATISRYHQKLRGYVNRSIRHARKSKTRRLRRRNVLKRFTFRGKRNFLTYVRRAAKTMGDEAIRKQMRRHWAVVHGLLENADSRAGHKTRPVSESANPSTCATTPPVDNEPAENRPIA